MPLSLGSPAFVDGGAIPALYTCEGKNISPALTWSGLPETARSLVLLVEDPDAPDPAQPRQIFVHWLLYNLPVVVSALTEAILPGALPAGTRQGNNDLQRTGYSGPCPPIGKHRYYFRLYALDEVLPDLEHPDKAQLMAAMAGHVVGEAVLMGTYAKTGVKVP